MKEPNVQVGILLSETQVEVVLDGIYRVGESEEAEGPQALVCRGGRIEWDGRLWDELQFEPLDPAHTFELSGVTIGREFHWERRESQRFPGALRVVVSGGRLTAINIVPVETYLTSVISSEMNAAAGAELLKAHAVISRSWLLAQLRHEGRGSSAAAFVETDDTRIRWYDREDHVGFDVCADDHCQRYQGVVRASGTEAACLAVARTRGEALLHGGRICDARFAKCCGGMLEEFRTCWDDEPHPYLARRRDHAGPQDRQPDLAVEAEAERWIRSSPDAFCHTGDRRVLSQVLNDYDQETTDFYRWRVMYTQDELAALVRERSGLDFGRIIDLVPVARGASGRLWLLKIVGTARTMLIGKELEIRRTLSGSHLYSSAFVVDREEVADGVPGRFVLTGAGWGHGVGLCQIGAAVMSEQGRGYRDILEHYYPGASVGSLYE